MKQALIAGALTVLALPVLAQDTGVTVNTSANIEKRPVAPIFSPAGMATPAPVRTRPIGSIELLSISQSGARLVYGNIPEVYSVLGITDEQRNAIQTLCNEAQAEFKQSTAADKSGPVTQDTFQKRTEKQFEISKAYELKIAALLTPDQKTQLDKIRELSEQKTAEDKKISETAAAARKSVLETYQKKLYAVLPPELARKIEIEDQARRQSATNSPSFRMMRQ